MKRFLCILLCSVLSMMMWYVWSSRPVDVNTRRTEIITIEKGMSLQQIAETLKQRGMIHSSFWFRLMAWKMDATERLRAGTYTLSKHHSLREIISILVDGKEDLVRVTIPEGLNVQEIDELLTKKGLISSGEFVRCAFECKDMMMDVHFLPSRMPTFKEGIGSDVEGYLFPETYDFNRLTVTAEDIMKRMLEEFEKRIMNPNGEFAKKMRGQGTPISDVMVMASLIEKESRHPEERAIISGILWKRLAHRMVLGVDAVNRYGLKKLTGPLTKNELEERTPYNSRRTQGLPPTPITNPGEASIRAALNPQESPYFYYLHDSSGNIHYATTNEEHNINKYKYLR